MNCRILLADDHKLVREGLRALLEDAGHSVIGEAGDGIEAARLARELSPDVAVLDLGMPLLNGLDAAREIQRSAPATKTLLLTMHEDRQYVLEALRAKVRGYVLKAQAAHDLERAIVEIMHGSVYLSPAVAGALVDATFDAAPLAADPLTARERQVLQLVAEGKTTKGIARLLQVSSKTVESHRYRIMKKLDIHDIPGLVVYAIRHGVAHI